MKQPRLAPIPGTNSCSSLSKCSMVNRGYCQDDYIGYFVPNGPKAASTIIRSPIINRGYYVRFKAVEYGWQQVLLLDKKNIIITLGSGFDTTPFRYSEHFFIEIDYPTVCREKARIIHENNLIPNFNDILGQSEDLYVLSPNYILLGIDLKNIEAVIKFFETSFLQQLVEESSRCKDGINFILFNECSLCYIEQNLADKLLKSLMEVLERQFSKLIYSVTYLGYEMLRSNTCRNDFGEFLLRHFESLGAPILTFITEKEIQERFNKLNLDQIQIINMKWFWREILNQDSKERERIKSLEPFDEWEELDNVCASYALTICRKFKSPQLSGMRQTTPPPETVNLPELSSSSCHSQLISVFGHCTEYDPDRGTIRVVGGFGFMPEDNSKHVRLKNIVELDLKDDCLIKANVIEAKNSKSYINRIHCRMVQLDEDHILLSGGRRSPSKPLANSIIKIDREANQFELIDCLQQNNPDPTYRHVCSKFGQDSGKLIQFGGVHSNHTLAFVMDIGSNEWCSRCLYSDCNVERHSMAFASFKSHSILINGGLDFQDDFYGSNHLELIDQRDSLIKQYPIKNFNQKLYSHRMKLRGDHEIIIIGGIGDQYIGNEVYTIDIRSLKVVNKFNLVSRDLDWLMLQNFDCELIGAAEPRNLWIIGGGGNCFSFGTHFNPIMSFKL